LKTQESTDENGLSCLENIGKVSKYAKYRTFLIRITQKSSLVEPTTASGHALFSATLTDASGEVKIMFFDELARK
jgi:hypothetical protein